MSVIMKRKSSSSRGSRIAVLAGLPERAAHGALDVCGWRPEPSAGHAWCAAGPVGPREWRAMGWAVEGGRARYGPSGALLDAIWRNAPNCPSANIGRTGYFAYGRGEHLFDLARQRPVAACMVEVARRRDGASVRHAQVPGQSTAPNQRGFAAQSACGGRSRPVFGPAHRFGLSARARSRSWTAAHPGAGRWRARAGGTTKLSARRGENSGQNGGLGLSRSDSRHSLSDLHMTPHSSRLTTESIIFEFVAT
jgi:hypothetical protein